LLAAVALRPVVPDVVRRRRERLHVGAERRDLVGCHRPIEAVDHHLTVRGRRLDEHRADRRTDPNRRCRAGNHCGNRLRDAHGSGRGSLTLGAAARFKATLSPSSRIKELAGRARRKKLPLFTRNTKSANLFLSPPTTFHSVTPWNHELILPSSV